MSATGLHMHVHTCVPACTRECEYAHTYNTYTQNDEKDLLCCFLYRPIQISSDLSFTFVPLPILAPQQGLYNIYRPAWLPIQGIFLVCVLGTILVL